MSLDVGSLLPPSNCLTASARAVGGTPWPPSCWFLGSKVQLRMALAPAAPAATSTAGTAAAPAARGVAADFVWASRWHLLFRPKMFNGPGGQGSVEVKLGEWGCHWSQLPVAWFTTLATASEGRSSCGHQAAQVPSFSGQADFETMGGTLSEHQVV